MATTPPSTPTQASTSKLKAGDIPPQYSSLDVIMKSRFGGAPALRGFVYQARCAALKILRKLLLEEGVEDPSPQDVSIIQLEGIEDLEHCRVSIGPQGGSSHESIQVKHSINKWGATELWGVIKKFVGPYLSDRTMTFRLMYNMDLTSGNATELVEASQTGQSMDADALNYWTGKFDKYRASTEALAVEGGLSRAWDWTDFSVDEFLNRVTFEQIDEEGLDEQIHQELIDKLGLEPGSENPYVNALLWSTLEWSRDQKKVTAEDLRALIEDVREDIQRGVRQVLFRERWMTPVSFEAREGDEERYFAGAAGRPSHIAAELPVRRLRWEEQILEIFNENEVTVIRAPSGHGKSTIMWQVVKELSERGWAPYELTWCQTPEQVLHSAEFLEGRVRKGELPLVVFDGLRSDLSAWLDLINRTEHLPIKYIVTTREVDWRRFGGDPMRLRLRPVSLEMTQDEAQAIYETLEQKGKLHENAPPWQVAWEQVEGLLIEYVALVTGGQMLKERIERQVTALGTQPDARAAFEILRLVSLADVMGLRLSEESLMAYVEERVGFEGPPDEVLRNLDDEFLRVEEESYLVRGVHPVRSGHLSERLNRSYRLKESLIGLIGLIDSGDLFEFCSQAPLLLGKEEEQTAFLKALAENIAERSYAEMVAAVEGTFCADAHRHWEANREVYDHLIANESSSFLYLLILEYLFSPSVDMSEFLHSQEVQHLLREDALARLVSIETDQELELTQQVLGRLRHVLADQAPSIHDPQSFAALERSFRKFGLPSPILADLEPSSIWALVETYGVEALGSLFELLHTDFSQKYDAVMSAYQPDLEERICEACNILSLSVTEEELSVNCFADESWRLARPMLGQFFSDRDRYVEHRHRMGPRIEKFGHTTRLNDFHSRFSNESSFRLFDLWEIAIISQYRASSNFEWQNRWHPLREGLHQVMDSLAHFFELKIRGHQPTTSELNGLKKTLSQLSDDSTSSKLLKVGPSWESNDAFERKQRGLKGEFRRFLSTLDETFEQGLIGGYLLLIANLFEGRGLMDFHRINKEILDQAFAYCDSSDLERREMQAYERLCEAARYFFMGIRVDPSSSNVLEEAREILTALNRNTLAHIKSEVGSIGARLGIQTMVLDEVIQIVDAHRAAVLAVDIHSDDDLTAFFAALTSLTDVDPSELGVDYFFVHVMDETLGKWYYFLTWEQLVRYRLRLEENPEPIEAKEWNQSPLSASANPIKDSLSRLFPDRDWGQVFEPDEPPHVEPKETFKYDEHPDFELGRLIKSFWKLGVVYHYLNKNPESTVLPKLEAKFKRQASERLASITITPELAPHLDTLEAMLEGREPISPEGLRAIFYSKNRASS